MESELAWAISGVLLSLLGVAVVVIVALIRRNGNGHNPNFNTIEVICQQQVTALTSIDHKLDGALLLLTAVRTSQTQKGG